MAFLAFAVSAVLLILYIAYQWLRKELWVVFGPLSANIFASSSQRPPRPTETDQDKRDKVLKQGFRSEHVPSDLDAIIIGSGIGGLTTAAMLSRAGRKVLVLEQHDRAGGSCHTFVEKGEWCMNVLEDHRREVRVAVHVLCKVANISAWSCTGSPSWATLIASEHRSILRTL